MGSIPNDSVISKCLSLIQASDQRDCILDYRTQKFTTAKLIKLMIEAQLKQFATYNAIVTHLRASESVQQTVDLTDISRSQLSRKLRVVPYEICQELFLQAVETLRMAHQDAAGISGIGPLRIIDSTEISLPAIAGQWAYCSSTKNAVKMHTRLVVASDNTVFPDRIIASTADVADSEVVKELVVDADAIYVMDRGYIVYRNYQSWVEADIGFVARIQKRNKTTIVQEHPVAESGNILRDAEVTVSFTDEERQAVEVALRLVEFMDDKGRLYRVLTNVRNRTAEQISEIYRCRWMVELFFKWIKQHLKFAKLYSVEPEAVWTQMYLALTAYALVLLVKLETGSTKTPWQVLELLREYMEKSWQAFLDELFRAPTRTSKGRQKKKKKGRPRKHPVKRKGARLIVR